MRHLIAPAILTLALFFSATLATSWADDPLRARLAAVEASIGTIQAQIAALESQLQAALTGPASEEGQFSPDGLEEGGVEQVGEDGLAGMLAALGDSTTVSTWEQLEEQDAQTGGPQGLEAYGQEFTDTPESAQYGPDGQPMAVGQAPSADQTYDLSAEMGKKEQTQAQAEAAKQEALDKATATDQDQWDKTLQQMLDSQLQQEQQNQAHADQLQQQAQQQMQDWQAKVSQGVMSEAEFKEKMDGMQGDHDAAMAAQEQENQEFLANAFADLMDDPDQQQNDSALGWQEPPPPPTPPWMQAGYGQPATQGAPTKIKEMDPVTVTSSPTTMHIWDHGSADGDRISISLNGVQVKSNLTITGSRTKVTLTLRVGPNQVTIKALNEGDSSPNTAAIKVLDVVEGNPSQNYDLLTGEAATMTVTFAPSKTPTFKRAIIKK